MAGVQIPASLLCSERDEHHRSNVPREVEVSTASVEFHISRRKTSTLSTHCQSEWRIFMPTNRTYRAEARYQFSLQWFQQLAGLSIDNAPAGETPLPGKDSTESWA